MTAAASVVPASRALVRASHPEPGLAVTTLVILLAIAMDADPPTLVVLGLAALTGQLTVGWTNDLLDADRDRAAGRGDKPLATGALRPAAVWAATAVALVATVVLSMGAGLAPGAAHLGLVATGWAYNTVLKRTVLSWLPYAVCFGLLPVVVSLAATGEPSPRWMSAAGALLGIGAHLVNAVPDLEDDRLTGVRGLPHRLGARRSLHLATILLLAGSVVTVVGPDGAVGGAGFVTMALVAALAAAGRAGRGPAAFRAALAIALVDVVALLVSS